MDSSNRYQCRTNKHGQTVVILAEHHNLPHISVSWYLAGMWEGGTTAVLPGETREQAALRAFGKYPRRTPLEIVDVEWRD